MVIEDLFDEERWQLYAQASSAVGIASSLSMPLEKDGEMTGGINLYAQLLLGLKSKDNSGAFRCYRVSKLAEIDSSRIRSRGYSFQEEILYWCQTVGCRIGETPILFENRRAGTSKINMKEAVSALWILLRLGLSRLMGRK